MSIVRKIISGYFLFGAVSTAFLLAKDGEVVESILCACIFTLIAYFIWPKKKTAEQQSDKGDFTITITAKVILFWFCCALSVIGIIFAATDQGESVESNIFIAAVFAVLAFFFRPQSEEAKQRKTAERAARQAALEQQREREMRVLTGEHTAGLPLAQGTQCTLHFAVDHLAICGGGNDFNLSYDKITDIQVHTDVEIQKSYVSSIGGAIAGDALFGRWGSVYGGRAREMKSQVEEYYFIVTYYQTDAIQYLVFQVKDGRKTREIADWNKRTACRMRTTITEL